MAWAVASPPSQKACVVDPSSLPDADIDDTFAAVGVTKPEVDISSNCGNIPAAIGPSVVDQGQVSVDGEKIDGEKVTVRIHNTNSGTIIHSQFLVIGGEGKVEGEFKIDGVAGSEAKIKLAFINPA
jgi:2-methylaconitate cis-trans-isomerase PrpF